MDKETTDIASTFESVLRLILSGVRYLSRDTLQKCRTKTVREDECSSFFDEFFFSKALKSSAKPE